MIQLALLNVYIPSWRVERVRWPSLEYLASPYYLFGQLCLNCTRPWRGVRVTKKGGIAWRTLSEENATYIYLPQIGNPRQTKVRVYHRSPIWWSPMSVSVNWDYLQEQKWLQDTSLTKAPSAWVMAHTAGNLEHTVQPASSSAVWRGTWVGIMLFQAVQLILESSLGSASFCLRWGSQLPPPSHSDWEGPSESGHFQGLPEAVLSCLRSFPAGWNVSILEETVTG